MQSNIRNMTRCALTAAMISVCAWITLPGPVPFTLQTFGVFLTLELLGGSLGTRAILVYLGLGLLGLPVFSGFRGGPGMLLGATGGFLTGFILQSLVFLGLERLRVPRFPAHFLSLAVCYSFGAIWYALYAGGESISAVLAVCVVPFVLPDLGKLLLAFWLGKRLRPHIQA